MRRRLGSRPRLCAAFPGLAVVSPASACPAEFHFGDALLLQVWRHTGPGDGYLGPELLPALILSWQRLFDFEPAGDAHCPFGDDLRLSTKAAAAVRARDGFSRYLSGWGQLVGVVDRVIVHLPTLRRASIERPERASRLQKDRMAAVSLCHAPARVAIKEPGLYVVNLRPRHQCRRHPAAAPTGRARLVDRDRPTVRARRLRRCRGADGGPSRRRRRASPRPS